MKVYLEPPFIFRLFSVPYSGQYECAWEQYAVCDETKYHVYHTVMVSQV